MTTEHRDNSPYSEGDNKKRQINFTNEDKMIWPNYQENDIERWITETSKEIAKLTKAKKEKETT